MDFRFTVTFTAFDTIVIRLYYAKLNSHRYCNTLYAAILFLSCLYPLFYRVLDIVWVVLHIQVWYRRATYPVKVDYTYTPEGAHKFRKL